MPPPASLASPIKISLRMEGVGKGWGLHGVPWCALLIIAASEEALVGRKASWGARPSQGMAGLRHHALHRMEEKQRKGKGVRGKGHVHGVG